MPVIKPIGTQAFNNMCFVLFTHLTVFSPGTDLPTPELICRNRSGDVFTMGGYQFNSKGELCIVPLESYKDRYIPPEPHFFKDKRTQNSISIQFMRWQDGIVILMRGQLDLRHLLSYSNNPRIRESNIIPRDNLQISYVLPITEVDCANLLRNFVMNTSFIPQNPEPYIIKQKSFDEGASSPFMARIIYTVLNLAQMLIETKEEIEAFGDVYVKIYTNLFEIRKLVKETLTIYTNHYDAIATGEAAHIEGLSIKIDKSIDGELRKNVESIINNAHRVFKNIQKLTKIFNLDIGFLYQKIEPFNIGISSLEVVDVDLANYLRSVRVWSQEFNNLRNDLEHSGWQLAPIGYSSVDRKIVIEEPMIFTYPFKDYIILITERLTRLVEEMTVYCFIKKLASNFIIYEVPLKDRNSELPVRFKVKIEPSSYKQWRIKYSDINFDEL